MRLKSGVFVFLVMRASFCVLDAHQSTIFLDESDKQEVVGIAQTIPVAPIKTITCDANIEHDTQQIVELLGLKQGELFNGEQFCKGIELIRHDKKLHRLQINYQLEKNRLLLSIMAYSRWTVRRIILQGDVPKRDQYSNAYTLRTGDAFDKTRHDEAIKALVQALHNEGYLSAQVRASLKYGKKTREVDIALDIQSGKRYTIEAVHLEGTCDGDSSHFESVKSKLLPLIEPVFKNTAYDRVLLEGQIDKLYNQCYVLGFADVEIVPQIVPDHNRQTIFVQLTFTLNNQRDYTFKGNKFFDEPALLKTVVFIGSSSFLMPPSAVAEEVETLYKNAGFLQVHVTWREHKKGYHFIINEGKRYRIADVVINGSKYATSEQLARDFFATVTSDAFYDARVADDAIKKCLEWYSRQGFWDCKIVKQAFTGTLQPQHKIFTVTLSEGKQRFLKKVTVASFPELDNASLVKQYQNLEKSIPFNPEILRSQHEYFKQYAQRKGYLYSSFEPEMQETEAGIIVTWKCTGMHKPVVFDKTLVMGSTVIQPDLIKQAVAYQEGDTWNQEAIDKTVDRLKSLNVFESISLEPADIFVPGASKPMIVRLVDDAAYEVRLRAGLGFVSKNFDLPGSGLTYRLGGSFVWKNPAKRADILRFDTDFTRYRQEGAVNYAFPLWSYLPLKLNFKAYGTQCNQPFLIGTPDILYKATRLGFAGQISGTKDAFTWSCNSGFEWLKISGISLQRAEALLFKPDMADRFVPYYLLEPTVSWDHLDNKMQPKHGWQTTLSLRGMAPLTVRDAWFVRMLAEQSFFTTPVSWLTLAFRLRGGTLLHGDFEKIMPPERFYLGGSDSLRGYEQDMAPPLNLYRDGDKEYWVPVGGKSMLNFNMEARFPIYGIFGGVVFNDLGILSQSYFTDVKAENILGSTGIGLRANLPFGTARFDVGWKWKKRFEDDRSFAWFLTLGHSF